MSGLKTLLGTLFLASVIPASGEAGSSTLQTFAACAGRLSAQLEHEWLIMDAHARHTEALRDRMIGLLSAVTTDENTTLALAIRINAKQSQASLMQRATFNSSRRDAAWAHRRAEYEVAICTRLILWDAPRKPRIPAFNHSEPSEIAARESESWPEAD